MRFLCYALILCLSILSPALITAAQEISTGTATVETVTPVTAAPEVAKPAPVEAAPVVRVAAVEGEMLPGTAKAAPQSNPATGQMEQDRQAVLSSLLSKLVNSYNELNAKYADLSVKYDKLQREMAESAATSKQNAEQASKTESENKSPEAITSYSEAQAMAAKLNAPAQQKPAPEQASAKPAEGSDLPVLTQYVKLKMNEDGREVEFMLDPMYVDMNFNFKRSTASAQNQPANSSKQDAAAQQPSSAGNQSYQPQTQQPQTQQPQMQPQIQYMPYSQPQQPGSQEKTADVQGAQQPNAGSRDVVDGIYRAQKYYYEKRYNDSLKAVQNSLMTHETALGYALEGSIYYTLGDLNAAVRSWRSALRLNPDMEDVRAALERYGR